MRRVGGADWQFNPFGGWTAASRFVHIIGVIEQPKLGLLIALEANPEVDDAPRTASDEGWVLAESAHVRVGLKRKLELPCGVAAQAQSTARLRAEDLDAAVRSAPNERHRSGIGSTTGFRFSAVRHRFEMEVKTRGVATLLLMTDELQDYYSKTRSNPVTLYL